MQILGNQPRAAFPSAEPKALQSRNETAGARPRKVTRSAVQASLGAGAPSHLHRHFAGMGYGFAGRGKAPSPATAARRRSLEGKRVRPLPIGRLRRPRARCRARENIGRGFSSPPSDAAWSCDRAAGLRPYKPPLGYPNQKAVMTDGLDKSSELIENYKSTH